MWVTGFPHSLNKLHRCLQEGKNSRAWHLECAKLSVQPEVNQLPSLPLSAEMKRRFSWIGVAFAYLALHALVATALPLRLEWLSTLGIVLAEVAAIFASLLAAKSSGAAARTLWALLSFSILLHATAMSLDLRAEILGVTEGNPVPGPQIFFSTLYGVPLLLAVSMQFGRHALRPISIIQAFLSLATGALFYIEIFSRLTVHGSNNPEDAASMSALFLILDLFLAIAATIRALGTDNSEQRRFFYVVSVFLWANTVFPAIHNWILVRHDYIWLDLFISAPYLILLVLIHTEPPDFVLKRNPNPGLRRIVQSASPIFLSLALLVLGVVVTRTHFILGLAAALMAILGYGTLNTMTQSSSMESEESLLAAARNLQELVGTDGLTGIANRRAFDHALERECATAQRGRHPVSLLMIDIDHFKLLNDSLGHPVGDSYLIQIAHTLRKALPRSDDLVARYGGEEFTVILPATDASGAAEVARKLHRAVAELHLIHPAIPTGVITVSIGCATFDGIAPPQSARLLEAADRALYLAKSCGRDRTESAAMENLESGAT